MNVFGNIDKRLLKKIISSVPVVRLILSLFLFKFLLYFYFCFRCGYPYVFTKEFEVNDQNHCIRFICITINVEDWNLFGIQFYVSKKLGNTFHCALYDGELKLVYKWEIEGFKVGINTHINQEEDLIKLKHGVYYLSFTGDISMRQVFKILFFLFFLFFINFQKIKGNM